jgi:threonine aldolase
MLEAVNALRGGTMPKTINLLGDTVTDPPPGMRRAMYEAELGDDVMGQDPTMNRLQERVAALLGLEAALFMASGTMSNLVAVLALCRRGDEILVGDQAHLYLSERGGSSVLGGTALRTVPTAPDGTLPLAPLRAALRDPSNVHHPPTGLICLENTHLRCGGTVLDPSYMAQVRAVADAAGVPVYLDGARLFNAAVHLGLPARELVRDVDAASFSFSKTLGAPVGSILAGTHGVIAEARRWRKAVGGGLRHPGVLAAAALYALEHMVDRLADDHAQARALAEGLLALPGLRLAQPGVQTNIVAIDVGEAGLTASEFVARAQAAGVLCGAVGPSLVRFATHYPLERADVEEAVARIRRAMGP